MGRVKLNDSEIEWMNSISPNLLYDAVADRIVGELSFCAYYDRESGDLEFGTFDSSDRRRESRYFFCDVFEVEIQLAPEAAGFNGWPKVYENRWKAREYCREIRC